MEFVTLFRCKSILSLVDEIGRQSSEQVYKAAMCSMDVLYSVVRVW